MAKSLNKNLVLTSVKTVASMVFPLITFPYVTRVLSASGIGEYNYANSLISYFTLIASLGIGTYAIREGARIRDDKQKMSDFASEMLSLNLFFTIITYLALGLCFLLFDEFRSYGIAISIFSISIIFKVIGVDWVFSIYEDYWYITVRSLAFQVLSVICLFVFVRSESDVYWYIAINVLSSVGSNVFNFFYARKYINFHLSFNRSIFGHLKAVVVIFSTTLATMIYVNADQTMLGWMRGTTEVGYYAVACKMYNVLKSIFNALVPVFMARLSYNFVVCKQEFDKIFRHAYNLLILFTIPLAVGSLFFSRDIILVLSGEEYLSAETGMKLLFFSMIFATLGNLFSSGGLLPAGKEKLMLRATMMGAVINVILNALLIPFLGCSGATFATLITETTIFFVLFVSFKKYVSTKIGIGHTAKCIASTVPFVIISALRNYLEVTSEWIGIGLICICAILYFSMLLILRDELVVQLVKTSLRKLRNFRS